MFFFDRKMFVVMIEHIKFQIFLPVEFRERNSDHQIFKKEKRERQK